MTDQELAQVVWDYMRYEQPLEKADVILGLGSNDIRTADWCAHLWHDKWADTILFTGGYGKITKGLLAVEEAEGYKNRAIELGVPEASIIVEPRATGTGENFTFSYKLLAEKNLHPQKIIIVTKPYMLRRAYATYMKQWPASPPKAIMSAMEITFDAYYKHESYSFEYVTNVMIGDLQRIIEYPKRGFQIEQDVPENVKEAFEGLVIRGYTEHLL